MIFVLAVWLCMQKWEMLNSNPIKIEDLRRYRTSHDKYYISVVGRGTDVTVKLEEA